MSKLNSVTAQLEKLDQDRKALEERAIALRKKAALALGQAVVDAGGIEIPPKDLKGFLQTVMKTGGINATTHTLLHQPEDTEAQATS